MDPSYETKLEWYRTHMKRLRENYDNLSHFDKDYCRYLERWFSDERCDGAPNYETRVLWKTLPMSFITYCFE